MPYLILEDFKGGVDRRRPIYAAQPGTLWEGINGHVTPGGDFECRKKLVDMGEFSGNTFGLFAQQRTLYTFGSDAAAGVTLPGSAQYQRLSHPAGLPMIAFVDADLFDGKIYVIARFADNSVQHFYDGVLVTDWSNGIVRSDMGSNAGIATALAVLLDASDNFVASVAGDVITLQAGTAGVPFTVTTQADDGGAVDDQTLTNVVVTPNVVAVTGVGASFSFSVAGGSGAGDITNLRVGGVEALGATIAWATSNTNFAALIAAQINTFVSAPEYTATSSGSTVTLTAVATGIAANALAIEVITTGTGRAGSQSAAGTATIGTMSGGVAAVAAVVQVNTLTVGGTFEPGDLFGVQIVSGTTSLTTEYFGNFAEPYGAATCVKTHKRKMYAGAGAILDFSRVNNARDWNSDEDPGAGFINGATHVGGSEAVLALETYQGRLAMFAREAVQLWTMQNDDDQNNLDQVLENTGTRCARSVLEFGGNDVFYLNDSGIRSLRARDASNNAFVSDVGVPIDTLVREWLETRSDAEIERAVAIVEPEHGRFWMAVGTRVFVYSFFPNVKIAAWSWYDLDFTPTDFARTGKQTWARGDDNVLYLYGGVSGAEYAEEDEYPVTMQLPFTSAQKPGDFKNFTGMDIAATGEWDCTLLVDPNELANFVDMGTYEGVTFPEAGFAGVGHATHVAPKLVNNAGGYCSVSKVGLYYAGAERKGP